jgi:glycosidase
VPLTYEINIRCWLRERSQFSDFPLTLANIPDSEFREWQRFGFTHVWLMGVWTSGPRSRAVALAVNDLEKVYGSGICEADIAGSPYAIAEYQVPESLGGEAGLQQFRRKLHEHGIKLLLDFVPNHVGLDHPWLKERAGLFIQSPNECPEHFAQPTNDGIYWIAHGKDPNFPAWTDTAQLDYRNPETRVAMQRQLLEVAVRCDGVRCDMAMLILRDIFARTWERFPATENRSTNETWQNESEFWWEAIAATKRLHPEFIFIAEAYWGLEARLQSLGFDFTYNKELYDALVRRDPASLCDRLLNSSPAFLSASVHFLENHDEPRIASLLSIEEHRAAALLLLSLPGMRLLHEGQLSGIRQRVPVQSSRRLIEPEHIREMKRAPGNFKVIKRG